MSSWSLMHNRWAHITFDFIPNIYIFVAHPIQSQAPNTFTQQGLSIETIDLCTMHNECHFISLIKVFRNSIDRCQMKTMINYLKMRCKHFRVHRRQWWWHVRSLHYVILALWIGGSLEIVTSSHHLNAIYKWSRVQRLRTIFSSTFTFNAHKSIDLVIIFADITRQQYACPIERHFCRAI